MYINDFLTFCSVIDSPALKGMSIATATFWRTREPPSDNAITFSPVRGSAASARHQPLIGRKGELLKALQQVWHLACVVFYCRAGYLRHKIVWPHLSTPLAN